MYGMVGLCVYSQTCASRYRSHCILTASALPLTAWANWMCALVKTTPGYFLQCVSLWPDSKWFLEESESIKPLAQLLGLEADSMLMSSELAAGGVQNIHFQGIINQMQT